MSEFRMLLTLLLMFPPAAGKTADDTRAMKPGQSQAAPPRQTPLWNEPDVPLFDFPITRGIGLSVEEILRPEQALTGFFSGYPMNH